MKTDKKLHRKANNKTNVCTCAFYTPKKQEKKAQHPEIPRPRDI